MLRVGCAGFPVARERYWRELSFVEADTGGRMPRERTLAQWREGAPEGAEFAVQASRLITHGPEDRGFPAAGRVLSAARRPMCGGFRDSLEVHEAWGATLAAVRALRASWMVLETPASFRPGPDRLRDMYRSLRAVARPVGVEFVWQPRGEWPADLARRVCAELGLVRAVDPLREPPPERGRLYFRVGAGRIAPLSVEELSTIRRAAAGRPAVVALSHRAAFSDARNLSRAERGS